MKFSLFNRLAKFTACCILASLTLTGSTVTLADTTSDYELVGEGAVSMEIAMHIQSDFCVRIPKRVSVYTNRASYTVGVKGNIAANDEVSVTPESTVILSATGEEDVVASVTQNKQVWVSYELNEDTYNETKGTIVAGALEVGDWYGSLLFTVEYIDN